MRCYSLAGADGSRCRTSLYRFVASMRCPICDQAMLATSVRAHDRLVTGAGPFGVLVCPDCHYGATAPQLSESELDRYYAQSYYEDFYEHSGETNGSLPHRLRRRYREYTTHRRYARPPYRTSAPPGRVLDVGCGSGRLLAEYESQGWETYGIDPSPAATAAAARRGATVHQGTLADQPWAPGSFDLIVFQHTLEHIVDPLGALERAARLLAPAGRLIVDVPNWDCWQRRVFGDRWFHLDLPRHQQHFSPLALRRAANRLGLQVRSAGTTSTAISTSYSLHYLIAGHWTPGWRLWLSYALSLLVLPSVLLADRAFGGDCCFVVMSREKPAHP